MKVRKGLYGIVMVLVVSVGCGRNRQAESGQENYRSEIEDWQKTRLANLKAPEGWVNLAGLFWLKEGRNTFGSDSSNDIVFPLTAPEFIGMIELQGDSVFLRSTSVPVMIDSIPAINIKLNDDNGKKPDVMKLNSLAWFIIKRGDQYGIRLRDYKNPMLDSLSSIPAFEINEKWRISAEYKPYDRPVKYMVPTIIGIEEENTVPGELTFRLKGKKLTLYPFTSGDRFFIIFGDKTNGTETYPSGRFLYTNGPDAQNRVIVDFNKCYNPPCAFTPYATCPLPLRKNILPVRIEAGEKSVHLFKQHNAF